MVIYSTIVDDEDKELVELCDRARMVETTEKFDELVLTYGLSKKELKAIEDYFSNITVCIAVVKDAIDCGMFGDHFRIVKSSKVTDEEMKAILGGVDMVREKANLIFIGEDKRIDLKVKIYKDSEDFIKNIKYHLMAVIHKKMKDKPYSRMLSNSLRVLKTIASKPGITTKEIVRCFENEGEKISGRTIERIIQSLNVAGESIEQDKGTNGWFLWGNISFLMMNNHGFDMKWITKEEKESKK